MGYCRVWVITMMCYDRVDCSSQVKTVTSPCLTNGQTWCGAENSLVLDDCLGYYAIVNNVPSQREEAGYHHRHPIARIYIAFIASVKLLVQRPLSHQPEPPLFNEKCVVNTLVVHMIKH